MFKLLLIWRYFIQKRMVLFAALAVTLLVMMVLVVLSVMAGLLADTRHRNHRWTGDLVCYRDSLVGFGHYEAFLARLRRHPAVAEATPVVRTFALISPQSEPVQIFGVRLAEFCRATGFGQTLYYQHDRADPDFRVPPAARRFADEPPLTAEQRRRGFIAGSLLLAQRYTGRWSKSALRSLRAQGLEPAGNLGWTLTVFGLTRQGNLAGSGIGDQQRFWYVDDSDSLLVDLDTTAVYVDFDVLQGLCYMDGGQDNLPRANEIRIKLRDGVALADGRDQIAALWDDFLRSDRLESGRELLSDVKVQTWKQYRRNFIAPAEREKILMIVVFGMIGLVAVFIIFALFYMVVTEKIKDLGILKSVGASGWGISQIFLGFGILVGWIGAVLGTLLGCLIVWNSNRIERALGLKLFDPDLYTIDRIPDVVDFGQAGLIAAVAVLASLLGAVLPAWRAAKLQVVEALRLE
ncbi:MAG: ABC transporter permease [Sedimentisphaerales bacterium]|nr:ABC transporter permease [Sedimentisphaerales bacterium]